MHIHYVKTTCMVAGTRHKLHEMPRLNIKIDGHDIANVSQQILLGLLIDDKLTWSAHIENVCSSLSSKISLLRQLAKYVSTNVLKKLPGIHITSYRLWVHHMVRYNLSKY